MIISSYGPRQAFTSLQSSAIWTFRCLNAWSTIKCTALSWPFSIVCDRKLLISFDRTFTRNSMITNQFLTIQRLSVCRKISSSSTTTTQRAQYVTRLENPLFSQNEINFLHFDWQDRDELSKKNPFEVHFLFALCNYLILQGYAPQDITILTTYNGQMSLFSQVSSINLSSEKLVYIT